MRRHRPLAVAAAGVLALAGLGCADDDGDEQPDTTVEDGGIERRDPPTVEDRGS